MSNYRGSRSIFRHLKSAFYHSGNDIWLRDGQSEYSVFDENSEYSVVNENSDEKHGTLP